MQPMENSEKPVGLLKPPHKVFVFGGLQKAIYF